MAQNVIVGEAYGDAENLAKKPFVGPTGQELRRMAGEADIDIKEWYLTNVLNFQPPGNSLSNLCTNRSDLPKDYPINRPLSQGEWLMEQYLPELDRLRQEIIGCNPNVILALGATALWALTDVMGINKHRGVTMLSNIARSNEDFNYKLVATFHPAHILARAWHLRPTTLADIIKARLESRYPDMRYVKRSVWIAETIDDLYHFEEHYLKDCDLLSYDIETARGQITCISLAPSSNLSLVLPFWDRRNQNWSYWDREDEILARLWLRKILGSPTPKLAQNGLYDTQYLIAEGIEVKNNRHDTMLIHHALQPEMPKGLGFLGSVYTNAPAWKSMRPRGEEDLKREE